MLNARMAEPDNYSDGDKMRTLQATADALGTETSRLSFEWETVATELEDYADLE